jgi:hypothetical protein
LPPVIDGIHAPEFPGVVMNVPGKYHLDKSERLQ